MIKTFLITLLFPLCSCAQIPYIMHMVLERVDLASDQGRHTDTLYVLLVTDKGDPFSGSPEWLGVLAPPDTLALQRTQHFWDYDVYIDRRYRHQDQTYYVTRKIVKTGFCLFIIPMKPFKRSPLWSLNMRSL
jgi:hypothetical protein